MQIEDEPSHHSDEEKNLVVLAFTINYKKERQFNCAVYNRNKRHLSVTVFNDNEHFSNIESLLIQLNPKEPDTEFKVYYQSPELKTEASKLNEKLQGIQSIEMALGSKAKDHQKQLGFLLRPPIENYHLLMKNSENMGILSKLIHELRIDCDPTNEHKLSLETLNLNRYMRLDYAAIYSLQIFPKKEQKKIIATNDTLFDILNRCKTSIGTRCLKRWMKQPLQDQEEINRRLDYIEYFIDNPQIRNYIQNQVLNSVTDLQKLYFTFYKVHSQKPCRTQMADLIRILKIVKALEKFMQKMEERNMTEFEKDNIYLKLKENVEILGTPIIMIEKNVVMEGKESTFHIRPTTQASLKNVNRQKEEVLKEIKQEFKTVKDDLSFSIDLITGNNLNQYMFEGNKADVQIAINRNKEYKQGTIRGKKMTFRSGNLARLCGELNRLSEQYQKEQKVIIKKMFSAIVSYYEILEQISDFLAALDVYTAWSFVISSDALAVWTRPEFGQGIKAHGVYHPCIANCISNNLQLINEDRIVIITGPNMGGKSTFIRMIGIAVYLAHIGFYVPAQSFQTPIVDAIITRVGASDVQLKGISTFMSQMLQSACMLKTATDRSLVLIDQLGRGTSTHEGFGIAWALCQYVCTVLGSYCLFATHFHQMTEMPLEIKGVINMYASCKINNTEMLMEYKIQPGKTKKSYGIQLIKNMNFPRSVLFNAQLFHQGFQSLQKGDKIAGEDSVSAGNYSVSYQKKLRILQDEQKMRNNGVPKEEISQYIKRELQIQ